MGYSHDLNRTTDSFMSLGAGSLGQQVDVNLAFLLGLSETENSIRNKFRISLSLDIEKSF